MADSCRAIFGSPRMLCFGGTGGLRMRNIFKLCLLVLTVAACLESAKAQEVPPGTYRETCVNIRVRYGTLYANCQDRDGRWRSTSLPDVQRCTGEVTNIRSEEHTSELQSRPHLVC